MTIPLNILNYLRYGWEVVAKLPVATSNRCAYIMIIPQAPSQSKYIVAMFLNLIH